MVIMTILSTLAAGFGVFCAAFGTVVGMNVASKKAELWGRKLPTIPAINKASTAGAIGWVLFIVGLVLCGINEIEHTWDADYSNAIWLCPLLATVIGFFTALLIIRPEPWRERMIIESQNALSLGELQVIRDVDAQIHNAKEIIVYRDRISLLDQQGYEYHRAYFQTYRLGELKSNDEFILLEYYFQQKYPKVFKCSYEKGEGYDQGIREIHFKRK